MTRAGTCRLSALVALAVVLSSHSSLQAQKLSRSKSPSAVTEARAELRARAARAIALKQQVVPGRTGWLFFAPELRSLTVGPFWGDAARDVTRASNKKYADPLAAIVDFHRQLKTAGIRLLVVPVPAKVAVYPDRFPGLPPLVPPGSTNPTALATRRLDTDVQAFHRLLSKQGVEVVDLLPSFDQARQMHKTPLYCRTDTHWSGRGLAVAAATVLDRLKNPSWLRRIPRLNTISKSEAVSIIGDLARMADPLDPQREWIDLEFPGSTNRDDPKGRPIPQPIDRKSPVLIIGDSHTLVFHDPALHARGAGFPDHIAAGLGFPVDLVGVRGSGATATRITLLRRRDNLAGKKLVIWCFSAREYTESLSGWRIVPVIRD